MPLRRGPGADPARPARRGRHLVDEARELDPQGVDSIRVDLTARRAVLRRGALEQAHACLERARTEGDKLLDPQLLGPLYAGLAECLARGRRRRGVRPGRWRG